MDPKISIVTVVYNNKIGLERTIQSVINQTYQNKEFIVIDGGSTDGTLNIVEKYKKHIDHFISEPDKGIYDAMNKGIKLATGAWINFMNSGDTFFNNYTLEKIAPILYKYENYALIYGNKFQNGSIIYPLDIRSLEVGEIMACHQSMFFNRVLLSSDLEYDLRFSIYGDYELVNRIYRKYRDKIKYVNITIAIFEGNGISAKKTFKKRKDKYLAIYESYGILGLIRALKYRILCRGLNLKCEKIIGP